MAYVDLNEYRCSTVTLIRTDEALPAAVPDLTYCITPAEASSVTQMSALPGDSIDECLASLEIAMGIFTLRRSLRIQIWVKSASRTQARQALTLAMSPPLLSWRSPLQVEELDMVEAAGRPSPYPRIRLAVSHFTWLPAA